MLRSLYGGIVDLLKGRASRDKVSQEDCGQAGILEAKIWNTTDKVTYIIKLLHLAKEHGIYLRAHPDYSSKGESRLLWCLAALRPTSPCFHSMPS